MTHAAKRGRGRPRAFDENRALGHAIGLFSASGFSAVGIGDITRVTGLTVGSIYKAYRDKEGIFAKALERYITLRETEIAAILESMENGRARIAALLGLYVRMSQGEEGKVGCLLVAGIAELPQFSRAGDALLGQLFQRRRMLINLIAQGQCDGSISASSAPETLSDLLLALLYGMRILGKAGSFTGNAETLVSQALKILD